MNDYRSLAAACLDRTEKELRDLLSRAALEGGYEDIPELIRVAQDITRLTKSFGTGILAAEVAQLAPVRVVGTAEAQPHGSQFSKEGNKLVVQGESRKRPGEVYQHKCPKESLDSVVTIMAKTPKITADSLRSQLHDDCPAYLPNICLRWLRHLGVIKKSGHAYEVLDPKQFAQDVAKQWENLPAA